MFCDNFCFCLSGCLLPHSSVLYRVICQNTPKWRMRGWGWSMQLPLVSIITLSVLTNFDWQSKHTNTNQRICSNIFFKVFSAWILDMKTVLRPPDLWLAFQRTKGSRMADEYTLQGDLSLQRMKQTEHRSVPRWEQMECEFLLRARRENEKWDNSSQLIHCTLKTHYFLRRKQKTCSPRWKEILCSRWRPWHSLPDFPHVCSFFYVRFSRFDSFLLTGSFVPAWQWYKD